MLEFLCETYDFLSKKQPQPQPQLDSIFLIRWDKDSLGIFQLTKMLAVESKFVKSNAIIVIINVKALWWLVELDR